METGQEVVCELVSAVEGVSSLTVPPRLLPSQIPFKEGIFHLLSNLFEGRRMKGDTRKRNTELSEEAVFSDEEDFRELLFSTQDGTMLPWCQDRRRRMGVTMKV